MHCHARTRGAQGFTLVELVVVIVLLGILAAVALPRFMNVTDDAEQSVIKTFVGAMYTARNEVYATMKAEHAGYAREEDIGIGTFVQCDNSPELHQGDPAVKWDGAWIGLSGLRNSLFRDANENACVGNHITFTTKTGHAIDMSMTNGKITWTATPAY